MTRRSLQDRVTRLDNAVHHGGERAAKPTLIIMHCTEGESAQSSIDYLNHTSDKKASYHYLIDRNGDMLRMCPPETVAYHAGDSAWPNPKPATRDNQKPNGGSVNARSLGIAWANDGEQITDAQLESALWLVGTFMDKYLIPPSKVLGHYEVSPNRKHDPLPAMEMKEFRALLSRYLADGEA